MSQDNNLNLYNTTVDVPTLIGILEQGNRIVESNGWKGVATQVIDDSEGNPNCEGSLVWFPGVKVSELR